VVIIEEFLLCDEFLLPLVSTAGSEMVSEMNKLSCDVIICFLLLCAFCEPGWALGEHGEWAKYSNFDVTTRVPLMFYVPGRTAPLPEAGEKLFPYIDPFDSVLELMEPGIKYAEVILLDSKLPLLYMQTISLIHSPGLTRPCLPVQGWHS